MPVTKSTIDRYQITTAGEWGTFCMKADTPEENSDGSLTYGGDLLIHSSRGSFAYSWNNCGVPFSQFLADLDYDYLMAKLRGSKAVVFDPQGSYQLFLSDLDRLPHDEVLPAGAFDKIKALVRNSYLANAQNPDQFLQEINSFSDEAQAISGCSVIFDDGVEFLVTKPDPDLIVFWETLWPVFVKEVLLAPAD